MNVRFVCYIVLQFYRVEVKVLPPEKTGQARTRSVLRRFSHFLKLHGKVGAGLASHACLGASLCITCNVMHKLATKSITIEGLIQLTLMSGRAHTHTV